LLARAGADYVVICGPRPPAGLSESERGASLWDTLRAGQVPAWLEPVARPEQQAFSVYRIRKDAAGERGQRGKTKS